MWGGVAKVFSMRMTRLSFVAKSAFKAAPFLTSDACNRSVVNARTFFVLRVCCIAEPSSTKPLSADSSSTSTMRCCPSKYHNIKKRICA